MSFSKLLILKSSCDEFLPTGKIIGVLKIEKHEKVAFMVELYYPLPNECYLLVADQVSRFNFTLSTSLKQTFTIDGDLNVLDFAFCIYEKASLKILSITFNGNIRFNKDQITNFLNQDAFYKKDDHDYDDEQIATENYYATNGVSYQNENVNVAYKKTAQEKENTTLPLLNENLPIPIENYFFKVHSKVDELLLNNPKNEFLNNVYKNGVFVDVKYNKNNYYTFGVIYEDSCLKNAKYICYVVLGSYNKIPNGFENISKFIPLKSYLPYGDGYYIIFQDAILGKTLSFKN